MNILRKQKKLYPRYVLYCYQTLFVTSFVTDCHGNGGKLVLYQINYYSIYVGYVVNGLLNYLMEILRPFIPTQKDTCINHIAI